MEKIIAVVVSFNRHKLLAECINAIKSQTHKPDAILVVNNGSSDYTSVWLDKQTDIHQVYHDNIGSAGGFNTGISWAYAKGFDLIWCMEDDGLPKEDALEQLLASRGTTTELLNCAVIDKEDKKSFVWKLGKYNSLDEVKEDCIAGVCHPFNGTLIHKTIVQKAGLPKSNLFYMGEASEYFYRIVKKHKIPARTILSSINYHPAAEYSHKKEWQYTSSWKVYFHVRNRYHVLKSKHSLKLVALINYFVFLISFAGAVVVYQKNDKFRKLSFIGWPMIDALTNNFNATDSFVRKRMRYQYSMSYSKLIVFRIKKYIHSTLFSSLGEDSQPAAL
jgi:rhamnopyranosyl-N-acetylglucosaminyl-diphospho-decaprenol beta-1,3/1,4-galactofuranosyltransferase